MTGSCRTSTPSARSAASASANAARSPESAAEHGPLTAATETRSPKPATAASTIPSGSVTASHRPVAGGPVHAAGRGGRPHAPPARACSAPLTGAAATSPDAVADRRHRERPPTSARRPPARTLDREDGTRVCAALGLVDAASSVRPNSTSSSARDVGRSARRTPRPSRGRWAPSRQSPRPMPHHCGALPGEDERHLRPRAARSAPERRARAGARPRATRREASAQRPRSAAPTTASRTSVVRRVRRWRSSGRSEAAAAPAERSRQAVRPAAPQRAAVPRRDRRAGSRAGARGPRPPGAGGRPRARRGRWCRRTRTS